MTGKQRTKEKDETGARADERKFVNDLAELAQHATDSNNMCRMYRLTRHICKTTWGQNDNKI